MSDLEVHEKWIRITLRKRVEGDDIGISEAQFDLSLVLLFWLILQQHHRPVNSRMCNGDGDDGQTLNLLNHQKMMIFCREISGREAAKRLGCSCTPSLERLMNWIWRFEPDDLDGSTDRTLWWLVTLTAWMVLHCPHCFRFSLVSREKDEDDDELSRFHICQLCDLLPY